MQIQIHPMYAQYFPEHGQNLEGFEGFHDYRARRAQNSECDISIQTQEKTWIDTAKNVALFLLKIVLFPWGLYALSQAAFERIAMFFVCPAQIYPQNTFRVHLELFLNRPENEDKVAREVVLVKDGMRYHGLVLGLRSHMASRNWALFAGGNGTTVETCILNHRAKPFLDAGYNLLVINGPGVGRSDGPATIDRIADAQEAGLTFLESAMKAQRIVFAGHSLGGAAIGLACLKHEFKPNVDYLAIRMMTFSRLTHIVSKLHGWLAELIFLLFGCEMDNLESSKKLESEGIHEVILQGGQDGLMSRVSLLEGLQKGSRENKTEIVVQEAEHNDIPDELICQQISHWEQSLEQQAENL